LGAYTLLVAPMGVKFGMEEGTFGEWRRGPSVPSSRHGGGEGPLLHAKFHPHRCNMSPLPGENLKIGL